MIIEMKCVIEMCEYYLALFLAKVPILPPAL